MNQMVRIPIILCLTAKAFAFGLEGTSSLHFDAEAAAKGKPVSKVIKLLEDMQKQLGKEAEEDKELYEQMVCWCTTNDKDKTKSIDDAEAKVSDLETSIEELTALSSRLTTEIEQLTKEVEENQKALEKATEMRKTEVAEFSTEEADALAAIDSMGAAIAALAKNHGASLLQTAGMLKKVMDKQSTRLNDAFSQSQKKKLLSLIQSPDDENLLQDDGPANAGSYAPASGEIIGMLKQMKETFETNVAQSQKDEKKAQAAYEELKASKEAEIAASQAQIETKTQELAVADEKIAHDKQDTVDTTAGKESDEEFLANLKEKCAMVDKEYEERLKTRQMEMGAISKAMGVLTSDDAQDTFSSTLGFVQVQSTSTKLKSKRRAEASKLLQDVARNHNSPRLMGLALRVRLDAFTKVKKAIDDMVAELEKQQEDERKQKDFCVDSFNENEKQTNKFTRQKTDLEEVIEDLTGKIEELTKAIDTLKAEIGELQVEMKRAGEDKDKESKEFQGTVADARATQVLLTKALDVLKGFYGFAQISSKTRRMKGADEQPAGPPPPPGFKAYKKNNAAGGVMGMIEQIINDAKAMESDALKAEAEALSAYEVFVTDTNASIEAKSKDLVNKSEEKAATESKRTETMEEKAKVLQELDDLEKENEDLHKTCDYLLKNFDVRQTARAEEMEALKQAKAILSGSKFGEFLAIGARYGI